MYSPSLFTPDTSMESTLLSSYTSFSTLRRKQSDEYTAAAACRPNLMDSFLRSASSSDASSAASADWAWTRDGTTTSATAPWDEGLPPTGVVPCTSRHCPACRAAPRFVSVGAHLKRHTARQPLPPQWWQRSTSFTAALTARLGAWVEAQLGACTDHGSADDDDDDASLPFDEQQDEEEELTCSLVDTSF